MMKKGALPLRNIDETWYQKPEKIRERRAAGGIVVRQEQGTIYVALISEGKYPDEYALPKGGIEHGEQPEDAARREIEEEAGLSDLILVADLGVQERLSFSKRSWAIIHYFLFLTSQKKGIPTDLTKEHRLHWFLLDDHPDLFWPEQERLLQSAKEKILQINFTEYPKHGTSN